MSAGSGRQENVGRPQDGRTECERDTNRIQLFEAALAEQRHSGERQHRPQPTRRPPAHDHGQHERAEHPDRHGRPERHAGKGFIEESVHARKRDPEEDYRHPVAHPVTAERRAGPVSAVEGVVATL